jgi:hypothetical protein
LYVSRKDSRIECEALHGLQKLILSLAKKTTLKRLELIHRLYVQEVLKRDIDEYIKRFNIWARAGLNSPRAEGVVEFDVE